MTNEEKIRIIWKIIWAEIIAEMKAKEEAA